MRRYHCMQPRQFWTICLLLTCAPFFPRPICGQYEDRQTRLSKVEKTFGDPPKMKRLAEKDRVWVDVEKHLVVVDGFIALRNGQLEMFACPVGTKEHESVVALFTKAQYVHTALLAAGAETGKPVQWEPKFEPPTGSEIEIHALWFDAKGNKQVIDARKWIRQIGKETLDVNWVFAGSGMWKDPDTGEERYLAESGDLVCLSNFTTATLDVPIKSSQANSGLLFVANTDLIPAEGTAIRLVFRVVKPSSAARSTTATKPNNSSQPNIAPKPLDADRGPSTSTEDKESLDLLTPSTSAAESKSAPKAAGSKVP